MNWIFLTQFKDFLPYHYLAFGESC